MDAEGASNERVDEQGPMEGQTNVEGASNDAYSLSEEAEGEGDEGHTSADSNSAFAVSVNSPRSALKSGKLSSLLHLVGYLA